MAIRTGMQDLVDRLRKVTNVEVDQYTIGGVTYWTDDQLEAVLDRNAAFLVDHPLVWRPQNIGGGTVTYVVAEGQYKNLETADSGTARWAVRDSDGDIQGTAGYSVDYDNCRLTFSADQGGTAYYLTGYTFDVHAAAVEIIRDKMAYIDLWYDFGADGAQYSRSQAMDNLRELANEHQELIGSNRPGFSGGVSTGAWYRTDVNP